MPILKLCGKKILMDYLGSGIMLNSLQRKRNPYYHLRSPNHKLDKYDLVKKIRMRWQSLWFDRCLAGRSLYAHAITSIPKRKIVNNLWINNSMNLNNCRPKFETREIPLIVHAPTNTKTKGTPYVEQAVDALKKEGYHFEYKMFHKVPHDQVLEFIRDEADIVVDQLISGGFGTLAIEAMCFGKPVCGYVMEDIREMLPDLPIIQCTTETIKEKLAWLIEHPEERIKAGKAGWEFAKAHFDLNKNNQELWALYEEILNE